MRIGKDRLTLLVLEGLGLTRTSKESRMMRPLVSILFAAAILVSIGIGSVTYAHKDATGVVKQRMDSMSLMAAAMKRLNESLKGRAPLTVEEQIAAAAEIRRHSQEIAGLFPAGSGGGVSEAKPDIWEDFNEFQAKAAALTVAAENFAQSVKSGHASKIKAAYREMAKLCRECHKLYRAKKRQ